MVFYSCSVDSYNIEDNDILNAKNILYYFILYVSVAFLLLNVQVGTRGYTERGSTRGSYLIVQ